MKFSEEKNSKLNFKLLEQEGNSFTILNVLTLKRLLVIPKVLVLGCPRGLKIVENF